MPSMPIGDLAMNFMQRSSSNRINRNLATLSAELTTGLKQNVSKAVGGHTAPIAAIERTLMRLDAQAFAATEAGIFANATGSALSTMSSRIASIDIGSIASGSASAVQVDAIAEGARTAFSGMIADLSTQSGGRPLFGGTLESGQISSSAEDIFRDLVGEMAGVTNAKELADKVKEYFDEDGGFDAKYLRETTDLAPFDLGGGNRIHAAVRADNVAIREALAAVALVAVLGQDIPLDNKARAEALSDASIGLMQGQRAIIGLEALTGTASSSIEDESLRIASERSGLETARLDLLSADPFEAASRLKQTETQLEALHTLTARLSRLSLTSFLR